MLTTHICCKKKSERSRLRIYDITKFVIHKYMVHQSGMDFRCLEQIYTPNKPFALFCYTLQRFNCLSFTLICLLSISFLQKINAYTVNHLFLYGVSE